MPAFVGQTHTITQDELVGSFIRTTCPYLGLNVASIFRMEFKSRDFRSASYSAANPLAVNAT